jgi:hypothetical protein
MGRSSGVGRARLPLGRVVGSKRLVFAAKERGCAASWPSRGLPRFLRFGPLIGPLSLIGRVRTNLLRCIVGPFGSLALPTPELLFLDVFTRVDIERNDGRLFSTGGYLLEIDQHFERGTSELR